MFILMYMFLCMFLRVHIIFLSCLLFGCPQGLTWEIAPDVGILEPGGNTSVSIKGQLDGDLSGLTLSQFRAVSLGSGQFSYATVNTTFYYCREVRMLASEPHYS